MKLIFSRAPSLHLRLVLAVVAAVAVIIADSRVSSFHVIRGYLDTSVSPFYFISDLPRRFLDNTAQLFTSRQSLEQENADLKHELLIKSSQLQLLGQYRQENIRLRELLGSPLRQDEYKMVTQVISQGNDPYSDQIIIDKGSKNGVYEGQPVISDRGVVGQVIAVSQLTSRVLLICDSSHALPVQILRNDTRAIATGTGCGDALQIDHISDNADIKKGDVLVTSGLGGKFPEGYPVGVVNSIERDTDRAVTVIKAQPAVELQRLRYLLLLWNSRHITDNVPTPSDVQNIANERLLHMMPQVILGKVPIEMSTQLSGLAQSGTDSSADTKPALAEPSGTKADLLAVPRSESKPGRR